MHHCMDGSVKKRPSTNLGKKQLRFANLSVDPLRKILIAHRDKIFMMRIAPASRNLDVLDALYRTVLRPPIVTPSQNDHKINMKELLFICFRSVSSSRGLTGCQECKTQDSVFLRPIWSGAQLVIQLEKSPSIPQSSFLHLVKKKEVSNRLCYSLFLLAKRGREKRLDRASPLTSPTSYSDASDSFAQSSGRKKRSCVAASFLRPVKN